MPVRDTMTNFWNGLDRGLKVTFFGAAVLVIALIMWGSYIALREDYRTLFSQLAEPDAAAIVEALKRQKVPYKLTEGGSTISVPAERVHETRLTLMSGSVPLSGGVGFEIFDKQGMGATEQSQRVSYQRALQGELARTIATLDNVKQARVHLVLPESSLFKRDKQEATAAVSLAVKPGHSLDRQQIIGVQRLIGASVAGLDPTRVIITDQRGITLSASDPATGSASGVEARLDLQRQVENHIAQKISQMLDNAFGSGQAIISVAVALNFDATKTTTQDVLPMKGNTGDAGIVRKRQTSTGGTTDTSNADGIESPTSGRRGGSTLEIEYEYGRRVEEVIAAPGAVKRVTVGVIVPPRIGEEQQRRIRELVQVAAGIDESRGDLVSVQSLQSTVPANEASSSESIASESDPTADSWGKETSNVSSDRVNGLLTSPIYLLGILIAVLAIGVGVGAVVRGRRTQSLSADEREELLNDIRRTLEDGNVMPLKARPR